MLLFLSDLHFTDETTAGNVNPEAFDLMAALAASTIEKRGVKEVHVVLLGDIFDIVRTAYWLETCPKDERPWNGKLDPRTAMNTHPRVESHFGTVLQAVLESESARSFAGALEDIRKKAAEKQVPFQVTYVLGNHDRALLNFPALFPRVTAAIPEIVKPESLFTSEIYSVLARHGHEWDDHCHGYEFRKKVLLPKEKQVGRFSPEAYEVQAIGEVITAELMGGIIVHARQNGALDPLIAELKDVNNLRPMTSVFGWLEWLGAAQSTGDQNILLRALRAPLDGVLESSLAREWDKMATDLLFKADLVDRLQQVRALVLGTSFDTFRKRINTVEKVLEVASLVTKDKDTLLEGAKQEDVFAGRMTEKGIQYVVYGHTHRARNDYVSGLPSGRVRMYMNTGTYLPLIARAEDHQTFGRSTQMTMSYLFSPEEDKGNKQDGTVSLDLWYGTRRKMYATK